MSEFVYLFRTTEERQREALGTPERAQKSMQAWLAWMHELESKGHLVDRGLPLERETTIVRKDVVTDGPYVEAKDLIAGFIVIRARDMAEAVELARGCPIAMGGGAVEIRPVMKSLM